MNNLRRVGDELILSCKYSPEWISYFHCVNGAHWDSLGKVWVFPFVADTVQFLREKIVPLELSDELRPDSDEKELAERKKWIGRTYEEIYENETRYKSETIPFKHQLIAWDFCKDKKAAALLMEMGTGKTKVVIDVLTYIQNHKEFGVKHNVIWVCPNSLTYNEVNEFRLHANEMDWTVVPLVGTRGKRAKLIVDSLAANVSSTVYIINYESVVTLEDELKAIKPDVMILDESTQIKNPQAQVSKAIHRLGKNVGYKYILTGTPITQSPIDIFSQYKFLDPTIFGDSFMAFRARYAIMGGFEAREVVGYQHIDELKSKIHSIGIRFLKEECLDLPEKMYTPKYYELSTDQRRVYEEMKKNLIAEFEGGMITAQIAIVKLLRLRQICSGFITPDTLDEAFAQQLKLFAQNPKLDLLGQTIDEIGEKKIIIWTCFLKEIEMIKAYMDKLKRPCLTLYGATTNRQELVNEFNKGDKPYVLVAQTQTGGIGLNLVGAHNAIYYSNSYSLEDRLQSEDRIHRIGQKDKCTYIDLVARATVEESVLSILRKKRDLASVVTKKDLSKLLEGRI